MPGAALPGPGCRGRQETDHKQHPSGSMDDEIQAQLLAICNSFQTMVDQTQPDVADPRQTDTIEASKNVLPPSTPMIFLILVVAIYCFYPLNMHSFSCATGTLVSPGES